MTSPGCASRHQSGGFIGMRGMSRACGFALSTIWQAVSTPSQSAASLGFGQGSPTGKVTKFKFDLKLNGLKTLELNTAALEQKIEGAHTLLALLENCGKSFAPFLQRTAPLVVTYMTFKNSRDIRETMAKCVYHMMMACSTTTEMAQVFNFVGETMLRETMTLTQKGDCESANMFLDQVSESVRLIR